MTADGPQRISDSTVHRLSKYYRTLTYLSERGIKTISSEALAQHNGVTAAQVRKDFSCFGTFGRRGLGYNVLELQRNIARIMGLQRKWSVALVGVGNVGRALLDYDQFRIQGFQITMAFDSDPAKIGREFHKVFVRDVFNLENDARAGQVEIGVVAVPVVAAQAVVDKLVLGGVKGILNFAPINLKAPPGVFIRYENMAIEIEALAFAITNPELVRND
ncbi:MAG: redox-sensing transcriptional repressor Rex [Calditrichaeota bacterium]|nr:redox-sensing transcriptional repressor Rex [Calditrichota bacterium]